MYVFYFFSNYFRKPIIVIINDAINDAYALINESIIAVIPTTITSKDWLNYANWAKSYRWIISVFELRSLWNEFSLDWIIKKRGQWIIIK